MDAISSEVRQNLPDAPSASQPHVAGGVVYGVTSVVGFSGQLRHVRKRGSEQSCGIIGGGGNGGGGDGGGGGTGDGRTGAKGKQMIGQLAPPGSVG